MLNRIYAADGGMKKIVSKLDAQPNLSEDQKQNIIKRMYATACQEVDLHPGSHLSARLSFYLTKDATQSVLNAKHAGSRSTQSSTIANLLSLYRHKDMKATYRNGQVRPVNNGTWETLMSHHCGLPDKADAPKDRSSTLFNIHLSRDVVDNPSLHIPIYHCANGKTSSTDRNSTAASPYANMLFESSAIKGRKFQRSSCDRDPVANLLLGQNSPSGINYSFSITEET